MIIAKGLYALSILLLGGFCLFLIAFGLREFVMLFEGMSLQLPLLTRILIAVSKGQLAFVGVLGSALLALTALAWSREGTAALAALQFLVFGACSLVVLAGVLPMVQLMGNLQ